MSKTIFLNYDSYVSCIRQNLRTSKAAWISSFNLNTGVNILGQAYTKTDTYDIMCRVNRLPYGSTQNRVLIGISDHSQQSMIDKVRANAEHFRNILWRYSLAHHLKCWIFFRAKSCVCLVGGRNLGDSAWDDVSFILPEADCSTLREFYDVLWKKAQEPKVESFRLLKKGVIIR